MITAENNSVEQADKAPPLLRLSGISKAYGHVQALQDVDFEVRAGEVVGLLGDNGAGKSTLVKIISGLVRPDSGTFHHNGTEVEMKSRRDSERIGVETIYQDIALVGSMSVTRNIFGGREITNRFGFLRLGEMRRRATEVLKHNVDIQGIHSPDLRVSGLSGGQQQAVAIARAVHFRNRMLVLDEPTSALSVRETEKLLAYIQQLREEGVSSVFVTHNLYHASQVCDRFVVMSHGTKVADVVKEDTSLEELVKLVTMH